jgi:hypothetical protein
VKVGDIANDYLYLHAIKTRSIRMDASRSPP